MPQPLAYLNGRLLPQSEAQLSFNDAGFVLGATVSDLCRTFHHRLYRLEEHLDRFRASSVRARIPLPVGQEELASVAEELVRHNAALVPAGHDLALVMFATPGTIGYYGGQPGGAGDAAPTVGMHTFPLPFARYVPLFRQGARLVVARLRHVPAAIIDRQIKQRSRLHWWLAEQEVRDADPAASAMLLDETGHVTETAAANIVVVRRGVVCSPPRQSILGGISLRTVEELCSQLGLHFEETPLTVDDCQNADEIILCSTPYCLAGVSRLNGQPLPWPGAIFERLLAAWSERVGVDIRGQIIGTSA
jgi:branched-subunit amino acid aminotransferase/4-amino-4-deoxychorismate lyase